MAFTEAQLLSDLATVYFAVDATPTIVQEQDSKGITWMNVNVLETGLSEKDKKPIAYRKNVAYYVYNKGIGGETAFYMLDQPINTSAKDVTIISSSYLAIANLYNSDVLQKRTLSAIITQCQSVFLESAGTTNHANRMKLVSRANDNLQLVVMEFMCAVAINATVQAAGTAVADSVLLAIVSGAWDSYANLIVA